MRPEFFEHHSHTPGNGWRKAARISRWVALGIVLAVVFAFVLGFLVKWLWNTIMPPVFGITEISYWQAVGLLVLAKIFFGGGPSGHGRPHPFKKWHKRKDMFTGSSDVQPPVSDIPEEQHDMYEQYWRTHGKVAFEAYVKELNEQDETSSS